MDKEKELYEETQEISEEEKAPEKDATSKIKRRSQPEPEKKQEDDNLCIHCGENKKAAGSNYCSVCISKATKTKVPVFAWICVVVVVLFAAVALLLSYLNFAPAKRILEGREALSENRLGDSFNSYEDAFYLADELNSELNWNLVFVGRRVRIEEAKVTVKLNAPFYAYNFLSQYFTEPELRKNPETVGYYNDFQKFNEFLQIISAIDGEDEKSADEALEKVAVLKEKYKDVKDKYFYVLFTENYIKENYKKTGKDELLKDIDEIKKLYPEEKWFYLNYYCDLYFDTGRYDECLTACDEAIAYNRNLSDAYLNKLKVCFIKDDEDASNAFLGAYLGSNSEDDTYYAMKIMMLRRFGDSIDSTIEECEKDILIAEGAPEVYRQQALNYLVKGDYDSAFDTAYNAFVTVYNLYSYGAMDIQLSETRETLYVCAKLYEKNGSGMSEFHSSLADILASFEGYTASENAAALIDGKKTPAEILTEGMADFV